MLFILGVIIDNYPYLCWEASSKWMCEISSYVCQNILNSWSIAVLPSQLRSYTVNC